MIIFVGSEIKGRWAEEVVANTGDTLLYVSESMKVENQINDILDHSDACSVMVFDVEQYTEDAEEVIRQILRIQMVNNAKIVLFAPGFLQSSVMVVEALRAGIKNFILGINMGDQKDQLRKCLNGYYDTHTLEEFGYVEPILETEEIKEALHLKNIGIAGSEARIGTTTQAIQIIKYLMLKGYKACYVEMNDHGWVKSLEKWYETDQDPVLGRITYASVDMYWDLSKLQAVLRQGYDYYIFDYGTCTDTDFDRTAFLRETCSICVCGSGAGEMDQTLGLIRNSFYNDVKYIFNFTPESERKEILQLMEDKGEDTFFSVYCPDPFTGCSTEVYQQLLPVEDQSEEAAVKKKRFGIKFPGRKKKDV